MIGWLSVVGTMLSYVLKKIFDKTIDLKTDERRKAARLFLTLYYAVSDLEALAKEILVELKAAKKSNDIGFDKEWSRCVFVAVDETTQRFLESTQGLGRVLEIYDPALAFAVSELEIGKAGLLNLASRGFQPQSEDWEKIDYTFPPDPLTFLDLDKYYEWYIENHPLDYSESIEWPDGVLESFADEDNISHETLFLREPESLDRLVSILSQQCTAIQKARELLKQFIEKHFDLQDMLVVRQLVKKFDMTHISNRMSDAYGIPFTRWITDRPIYKFDQESGDDEN